MASKPTVASSPLAARRRVRPPVGMSPMTKRRAVAVSPITKRK